MDTLTADQLKSLLDQAGWSRRRLAHEMGVTVATVSRWTNGHHPIPRWAVRHMKLLGLL